MYISCPSSSPINFKIIQIGGTIITGTVSRDNPYTFPIGSGLNTQLMVSKINVSSVMNNKGFIVEAEDLVYVTVRLTATPENYQAGGLVSKGLAALGTQFRVGAFINTGAPSTTDNHYTFAAILATENNTTISFSDINAGVSLINNAGVGNTPGDVVLNSGESYVFAVEGPGLANKDGLIGAGISSDKPIVVNCGSFAGSNGTTNNLDLGFDQIVSAERTGTDYIFIKGNGVDATERPLIVANENATDVYLNGGTIPYVTLSAGDYLAIDGSLFSSLGNLFVKTSKKAFAYQGIGGTSAQQNQNMHFVPPLSCETPKIINNIPFINQVGNNTSFTGTVCVVTETGAALDFIINGDSYSLATLPTGIIVNGPQIVTGNANYVTYTFQGLNGNISLFSTKQVYLSYFGSSGAATYGGFYSGFTFKPEITLQPLNLTQSNCIPNVELKVNTLTAFDVFQWYFDGAIIPGATAGNYFPTQPGYYYVSATISACNSTLISDEIPVSSCATNNDNDIVNDNIDIDNDNDGIPNCQESLGNSPINLLNSTLGGALGANSYVGLVTTAGPSTAVAIPFAGNSSGNFVTEVPAGKGNSVTYKVDFTQPISLTIDYVSTANVTDLINSNANFKIKSPINKTITVVNPTNQLLIDTNYDGIYETGVTQFSSFEIRFRLNSSVPLAAGTGTFRFQSNLTSSLSITQENLSDTSNNKATFSLYATCLPIDSDGDTIVDQLDIDSDNDGILDNYELQSQNFIAPSNVDANQNGMDDVYETNIIASDFDLDGIPDYLDLDSDNDGIYDVFESGANAIDANLDGRIDGNLTSFGLNGLFNGIETSIDNGIINYTIANTDSTQFANYVDLDSDGDDCFDVIEAGFSDGNTDNFLGNNPTTTNSNGIVTNGNDGYTLPNPNYITIAPIVIINQPTNQVECELENAQFSITTNAVDGYQWQVSTDGMLWINLINDSTYANVQTNTLTINSISPLMNGFLYRVMLSKTGNSCGLISAPALLTTYALPVVANNTMVQCDTDLDTISNFNLTVNNNLISSNFNNETFSYYTSFTGADAENPAEMITNPYSFSNSSSPGVMQVWVRVVNSNNCYRVATLTLQVVATNIPSTFTITVPPVCDDFLDINGNNTTNNDDRDGISSFNFAYTKTILEGMLPVGNYSIKYYRNQADAESEFDSAGNSLEISQNSDPAATNTIFNYRNIGYPDAQNIWVRIVSDVNNGCYGLGPYVSLVVEALPFAYSVIIPRECDTDQDGIFNFNTSTLETTLLQGQTNVSVTYFNSDNSPLLDSNSVTITSPFPNTFSTTSKIIKVVVTNNSTLGCFDETLIEFIVDKSPVDFTISSDLILECDDEANPLFQDGDYNFMSSSAIHNAIASIQPSGMIIEYYDENNILLSSPLPNPLPVSNSKTIKVVVKNAINPSCKLEKIIEFKVLPTPKIELAHVELICSNIPTFFKTLTAGIQDGSSESDYTYIWAKDGVTIATANSSTLDVNEEGIYKVKVTNSLGCSHIRTIEVIASEIATLSPATIVDLIDICTVTINATGLGDYVYALDNINGPYQIGSFFDNVYPGIHQIYVKDSNECGIATQTIAVVGAPHFFTPNGDGVNDTWQIQGVNAQFYGNSKIYIFDRYGKLLKQIGTTGLGWDGTFNGEPLPASDYWFSLLLEDGRNLKGHFTLKR